MARARRDRQCVRARHVGGNALLGRRQSGVERGAARVRGGMAEPTEVGCVALAAVSRPNATLVEDDVEVVIRGLKAQLVGEISVRSEEHTSELQSLMRISSSVFCLYKQNRKVHQHTKPH